MEASILSEKKPLKGLKVIDLSNEKASFCSRLLADIGAEVIRIEATDLHCSVNAGPFWETSSGEKRSPFYLYNNANKLSVTLNLDNGEDLSILRRWMESADVVIETSPPGYMKDREIDFDKMSRINPGLIMVSVTGFGQTGPYRNYPSCDIVASASGGQMYVTGSPSYPPLKPFGEQSFYTASLFGAIGVLLALRRRLQTGMGEHIDISMQEAVASTLDHVMVRFFYEKEIPQRQGNIHWDGSFSIFPCLDGHILISLFSGWETLVELMGMEGMADDLVDERWNDEEFRRKNLSRILEKISRWTRRHKKWELFELGQLMRFPWAPVLSPSDVLKSPHLKERGFFKNLQDTENGNGIIFPGHPFRFSNIRLDEWKIPPSPGKDNPQWREKYPWTEESSKYYKPEGVGIGEPAEDILSGVRILDLTWLLAGPYATRILADFGAEVIKVQSKKTARGGEANLTGYFNTYNRNKKGITLNMDHPEAKEMFLRLVAISDVVVENFSPRVMHNWGLDYEKLKRVKPDLIMLSMSAMGQTGPWKDYTALGPTIHALSGLTYMTSYSERDPLGPGLSHGDIVSGLYGALAILIALEYRRKTGMGNFIDLSQYEAMCTLLGPTLIGISINGKEEKPSGNRPPHLSFSPYGCYRCDGKDRWCVIALLKDAQWPGLCRAMGRPELIEDKRFSTRGKRMANADELDRLIEEWTTGHDAGWIVECLRKEGIPAGVVLNAEDLFQDPHLQARGFFSPIDHPVLGRNFTDSSPIRFLRYRPSEKRGAPLMGQDNRYVFLDLLGLSEGELLSLIERGVIS